MPSISRRTLQEIRRRLKDPALIAAVNASLKPKRGVVKARRVRKVKTADKRNMTREIRAYVFGRASGNCECGCGRRLDPGELDHFFGRGRVETAHTCWALSHACHQAKTLNQPSRGQWLLAFAAHCRRHHYVGERERAEAALQFYRAKTGES
jgi:hypothetical protein